MIFPMLGRGERGKGSVVAKLSEMIDTTAYCVEISANCVIKSPNEVYSWGMTN